MSAALRQFALAAGFAAAFLAAFALAKAVMALAGVETYARFALYLSFGLVLRVGWFGIVGTVFARGFSIARQEGSLSVFRRALGLSLWAPVPVLALAGAGCAAAGLRLSFGEITLSGGDFLAGALLGACVSAAGALVEVANAMRMRAHAIASMLYPPLFQIGAVWVLRGHSTPDATAIAALAAAGCLSAQALQWVVLVGRLGRLAGAGPAGTGRPYEIGAFLAASARSMAAWIPAGLASRAADRWIVAAALPARDFAAFSVIMLLTQGAMAAASSVLGRVMLPQIYDLAGSGGDPGALVRAHRLVDRLSSLLLLSAAALGVVLTIFGPAILGFLGPGLFEPYARDLLLALVAASLQALGIVQLVHGHVRKTPAAYTRYRYAEAVAYVVLILAFLPRFGLTGVFLGACLAEAFALALALLTTRALTRRGSFRGA